MYWKIYSYLTVRVLVNILYLSLKLVLLFGPARTFMIVCRCKDSRGISNGADTSRCTKPKQTIKLGLNIISSQRNKPDQSNPRSSKYYKVVRYNLLHSFKSFGRTVKEFWCFLLASSSIDPIACHFYYKLEHILYFRQNQNGKEK